MSHQVIRTENQLAAVLRRERRTQGLTQQQLADKAGLRQATISRLEDGAPAMQLRTLVAVLAALNLEFIARSRTEGPGIEEIF